LKKEQKLVSFFSKKTEKGIKKTRGLDFFNKTFFSQT